MIYSRNNLNVVEAASDDPVERNLFGVLFESDGGTVAADGEVILAVAPAETEHLHMPDLGDVGGVDDNGVFLDSELVKQAEKQMPKDNRLSLQHCGLTRCTEDASMVEFSVLSPDGKIHRVAGHPYTGRPVQWKEAVNKVRKQTVTGCTVRMKSLMRLMTTLEKVTGKDKAGNLPVEITMGPEGLCIRTVCMNTGQHIVAVLSGAESDELEENEWERGVFKTDVSSSEGNRLERKKRRLHR